jgi:transcriptional regulator with XRE-family HTH domain
MYNRGMKGRLKILRKELGLTQSEFGKRIGMSDTAISHMESGRTAINAQNINLICLTFNVSANWLQTGEGEIFLSEGRVQGEDELIEIYRDLLYPNREVVLNTAKSLLKAQEALQPEYTGVPERGRESTRASANVPLEKGERTAG